MASALLTGLFALALCLAVSPLVLALLRRAHILDHPSARSSHDAPVPRGGGIAPGSAALLALSLTAISGSARAGLIVASAGFGLVGLVEDVVGVRALPRLALQFAAALLAAALLLDHLTGPAPWRLVFGAGAVLWVVAFVNAYNFMDGINGISVAQAVGAGATWFLVGTSTGTPVLTVGGAVAAGAALGFVPFNMPRARMFLGDAGSYFFGAWLASVAVLGLRAGVAPEAVFAPLALYLADTGATLVRRAARGEQWYSPHRQHSYQRLVDGGWSHLRASAFVAVCIGVCGALGAVSLDGGMLARAIADLAAAAVILGYLSAPRLARASSTMAMA